MVQKLYNCVLFHKFNTEQFESLMEKISYRILNIKKGEILIEEGQMVTDIGIVIDGELCESKYFADGSEQLMQKLRQNYMVGIEAALSLKKTSPYHVYAVKDSQIFCFESAVLDKEDVLTVEERMKLYKTCVEFLANDNIRRYKKIELLSVKNAKEKVYRYLCFQRDKQKSNSFRIGFDREQLANYLGLNRSVLSHTLKKMECEGILRVSKNRFELTEKFDGALK